jgi:hypothetical protein
MSLKHFYRAALTTPHLQKGGHDDEDPYARQAREALLRALQVRGNRPLYTVDSSELTVPLRVHHGGHAMICQGIRDGLPVAIKVSSAYALEIGLSYEFPFCSNSTSRSATLMRKSEIKRLSAQPDHLLRPFPEC